jgi:ADP-ribose pyrophosphatase YjhB (NUDIX family)
MDSRDEIMEFVRNGHLHYLSQLTIECVIFGYHDRQLKVLLGRYAGLHDWGLPSGFIKKEEPISEAVARILKERTSLDNIFLQQFHVFGDNRERIQSWRSMLFSAELRREFGEDNWLTQRTVSVGYYALIDFEEASIKPDAFYTAFEWHNVTELPRLLFDHNEMVEKALVTMRNQLHLQPIGYNLLPEKFTLPEIQTLYETILVKELHRRNFPTKLMALGILIKLDEKRKIGQHRSPFLYKFDKEKYEVALKHGVVLAF